MSAWQETMFSTGEVQAPPLDFEVGERLTPPADVRCLTCGAAIETGDQCSRCEELGIEAVELL